MGYKTATKEDLGNLAKQMVGRQVEEAEQAVVDKVMRQVEMRVSAVSGRLSQVEQTVQGQRQGASELRRTLEKNVRSYATKNDLEGLQSVLERHIVDVADHQKRQDDTIAVIPALSASIDSLQESLSSLRDHVDSLRDGALEAMLNEVREQAVQRDKILYHRIEDLGGRTKAEITAEKAKLLQQFKESARITEERRESVVKLEERVDKALNKYGNAYTALLREFEALKAGIKIGKGE